MFARMLIRSLLAIIVIVAGAPHALQAQDLLEPVADFTGMRITDVIQDSTGFIWVGTDKGLFRYDGYAATYIPLRDAGGSELMDIRDLEWDSLSLLWIVTPTTAGTVDVQNPQQGLQTHLQAESMEYPLKFAYVADSGRVWIAVSGLGLYVRDAADRQFDQLKLNRTAPFRLEESTVHDIWEISPESALISVTGRGVFAATLQGESVAAISVAYPDASLGEADIVPGKTDIWLASESAGVFIYSPDGLQPLPVQLPLITAIHPSATGNLWMASLTEGLVEITPPAVEIHRRLNFPARNHNTAGNPNELILYLDRSHTLWVGSDAGLYNWSQVRSTSEIAWKKLPGQAVRGNYLIDTALDERGSYWLLTSFGHLLRADMAGCREIPLPDLGDPVLQIQPLGSGEVMLLGTASRGLILLDMQSGKQQHLLDQTGIFDILALHERIYVTDLDGTLWMWDLQGLPELQKVDVQFDSDEQISAQTALRRLQVGPDGTFLALTDASRFVQIDTQHRAVNQWSAAALTGQSAPRTGDRHTPFAIWNTLLVYSDARDIHWINMENGATGRLFDQYQIDIGSPRSILSSGGVLWIATDRRMFRCTSLSQIPQVVTVTPTNTYRFAPDVAIASESGILVGGEGAYVLFRDIPRPETDRPVVIVRSIQTLSATYVPFSENPPSAVITVPDQASSLTVDVATLDFNAPEKHQFAYRLSSLEAQWSVTDKPTFSFQHIPPGDYTLQIIGSNGFGSWSEVTEIRLRSLPPLWQRWQFIVGLFILAALGGLLLHRIRTRSIARQKNLLKAEVEQRRETEKELLANQNRLRDLTGDYALAEERERRRISQSLHDQVGHALSLTQVKLSDIVGTDSTDEDQKSVREAIETLEEAIQATRALTIDISPPALYEFGLVAAAENLLERMGSRYDIVTVFEAPERRLHLATDIAVTLYQIIRELSVNVIKHADADVLKVSIFSYDTVVTVRMRDNGVGFDVASTLRSDNATRGLGLYSIRERVTSLGGTLRVISSTGKGADITISIPMNRQSEADA